MTTTPPGPSGPEPRGPAPVPIGYRLGDYVPFKDRDPANPSAIAGEWAADHLLPADLGAAVPDSTLDRLTPDQAYRALYGADAPDRVYYASWGLRVMAYLVDGLIGTAVSLPFGFGLVQLLGQVELQTRPDGTPTVSPLTDVSDATVALVVISGALAITFGLWNTVVRQGLTGYSLGKSLIGIRVVRVATAGPTGVLLGFVRQLAHVVDNLVCYLGWLWPLWDPRHQTLGDKIVNTVVVVQPAAQPVPEPVVQPQGA